MCGAAYPARAKSRATPAATVAGAVVADQSNGCAAEAAAGHARADGAQSLRAGHGEVELGGGDLEVVAHGLVRFVEERPDRGGAGGPQCRHGVEHPLVFGDDVADPAVGLSVELCRGAGEIVRAQRPQAADAQAAGAVLAGTAAAGVAAVGMGVAGAGVDHEQPHPGTGEAEGNALGRQALAVQQDADDRLAKERGRLVHDAGGRADHPVLGQLADPCQFRPVQARAPRDRSGPGPPRIRWRRRTTARRRPGHPRSAPGPGRHAGTRRADGRRTPIGPTPARAAAGHRPGHAEGVRGPAGRGIRVQAVEADLHDAGERAAGDPQQTVCAARAATVVRLSIANGNAKPSL